MIQLVLKPFDNGFDNRLYRVNGASVYCRPLTDISVVCFISPQVGTVRLHYVVVSELPVIASSTSLCSGQSSGSGSPFTGQMPTSAGHGQVSTNVTVGEKIGRPRRRVKRKSDVVVVATGCGSGSITTATADSHTTHSNDTVLCIQQHRAAPARHSATSATNDAGNSHAGRNVFSGKQHSAGTGELAHQHSAAAHVGQSDNQHSAVTSSHQRENAVSGKSEALTRGSAVTTTCWTNTTVRLPSHTTMTQPPQVLSKDSVTTAGDAFVYPRDCLATVSTAMYANDGGVSMLWLPDQSVANDDGAEKEDDAGCKLMMSPASFHFIPLIAAPPPYPCIEPMYVDVAAVDMAALGVGMPTAGVGIAAEHVGMAVTDVGMETGGVVVPAGGVGMATAGGQVGHCLVSVEDDVTTADALVWPTLYPCCDGGLPPLGQPHVGTPTSVASVHPNAHLTADAASTSCQLQFVSSAPTPSILPHAGLPAAVVSHNAPSATLLDGPESSLTLAEHADNPCGKSVTMADGPVSADGFCQSALEEEDAATGDAELQGGSQVSAGSRPDVVSSNLPRTRIDLQPQPRQQEDDDDDDDDDIGDENDEMSREPPASSVDEQLNNDVRQPPPPPPSPPPSPAASVET